MMNLYITTEQEQRLLNLSYDTERLSLRERNTISKLQIISYKGQKVLKSVEDVSRKLRIVLATLLIKIFVSFNKENQQRLNTLKEIIYSATLKEIQEKRGIEREHLLKSIAQNLMHIRVGFDSQAQIIRLFNTVPFFDEVIMKAFGEYSPQLLFKDDRIQQWLALQLNITLDWNATFNQTFEQHHLMSLIGLYQKNSDTLRDNACSQSYSEYMRYSIQDLAEIEETDIPKMSNQLVSFPQTPDDRSTNRQDDAANNNYLLMSIQSASPTKIFGDSIGRSKKFKFSSEQNRYVQNFGSAGPLDQVLEHENGKSDRSSRVIRLKRKRQKENNSGVWNFLCCRFANDDE